jgi:DNA invertase Pin-like site-specific DNA recombinase
MSKKPTARRRKKKRVSAERVKKLYVEKGWPRSRIASHLGVSDWSIEMALRRLGVPLRPRSILGDKAKRPVVIKQMKDLYLKQGLTVEETARRVHIRRPTVSRILKSEGVTVPKKPQRIPGKPKRNLEKILHLYLHRGWTAERIAEHFGCTTRAIFHQIYNAGKSRASLRPPLDPAKIKELYIDDGVTVKQIAEQFRVGHHAINKILDSEGIERGHQRTSKKRRSAHYDPRIAQLDVGESFQVQCLDPLPVQVYFSRLAKGLNIRISTQRVSPTALLITRYA